MASRSCLITPTSWVRRGYLLELWELLASVVRSGEAVGSLDRLQFAADVLQMQPDELDRLGEELLLSLEADVVAPPLVVSERVLDFPRSILEDLSAVREE